MEEFPTTVEIPIGKILLVFWLMPWVFYLCLPQTAIFFELYTDCINISKALIFIPFDGLKSKITLTDTNLRHKCHALSS
eukprot:9108651-Ditylum_brightwellii.AAC.1